MTPDEIGVRGAVWHGLPLPAPYWRVGDAGADITTGLALRVKKNDDRRGSQSGWAWRENFPGGLFAQTCVFHPPNISPRVRVG